MELTVWPLLAHAAVKMAVSSSEKVSKITFTSSEQLNKFAGPSAQRRVRSSTIVVVFIDLSIIFDIGAAPGTLEPCCGRLGGYSATPRGGHGDPWAPTGRFLSIFRRPEAASKNQRFFAIAQNRPRSSKNHSLGTQGSIFDGFLSIFGVLFGIIF